MTHIADTALSEHTLLKQLQLKRHALDFADADADAHTDDALSMTYVRRLRSGAWT